MRSTSAWGMAAGAAVFVVAGAAEAAGGAWTPAAQESKVGLEVDWLNTAGPAGQLNSVTFDLVGQFGITRSIFLDVDISWAYVDLNSGYDGAIFGNPILGAHYAGEATTDVSFFVGGGLGIPVIGVPDDFPQAVRVGVAAATRGYFEIGRFGPKLMPIFLRAGIEVRLGSFYLQSDLAPNVLVAVGGGQTTAVVMDQGNDFGVRADFGGYGGLRLQESFVLTDTGDHVQTAIEPFIGYSSPGSGLFARFGLLVALDEVLGFGFDQGKVRTSRFTVGGKF